MSDMWRCPFTNCQILLPVRHTHRCATAASRAAAAAAASRANAITDW
jgi:hypothetical protein